MLGRLLAEISWEGNASKYRQGGRGFENVLMAEVWQALDFLPRGQFFGEVLRRMHGSGIEIPRSRLLNEAEEARFDLLPGAQLLSGEPSKFETQPDAIISSPGVYCFVEGKRLRAASFQVQQLAKELVAVCRDAAERLPLLLLVIPEPPPILVRGHGRQSLRDAIRPDLASVIGRTRNCSLTVEHLDAAIDSTVAWVTWDEIRDGVIANANAFAATVPSAGGMHGTVQRLATIIDTAIRWHGPE
jgi:hypothetical protein